LAAQRASDFLTIAISSFHLLRDPVVALTGVDNFYLVLMQQNPPEKA